MFYTGFFIIFGILVYKNYFYSRTKHSYPQWGFAVDFSIFIFTFCSFVIYQIYSVKSVIEAKHPNIAEVLYTWRMFSAFITTMFVCISLTLFVGWITRSKTTKPEVWISPDDDDDNLEKKVYENYVLQKAFGKKSQFYKHFTKAFRCLITQKKSKT